MSLHNPLASTTIDPAPAPAQAFADAVDHARRLLVERARSNAQVIGLMEMDAGFAVFAAADTAITLHEHLQSRLEPCADTILAIGPCRYLLISQASDGVQARQIARRAMEAASRPIDLAGRPVIVLGFTGAAFLSQGGDVSSALQRAAVTLTQARRRDRRCLMDQDVAPHDGQDAACLAASICELEDALQKQRFRLALQPVLNARTRQVRHYEALLRLSSPDRPIESASRLIAAAEAVDVTARLDATVLTLAADHLARDPTLHLAVNISAASARDAGQGRAWLDQLAALGSQVARVTVELTETAAPDVPDGSLADFAAEVRRLGATFSLDDFGSGHTSYRTLLALRPDEVKIDGCFVREVRRDAKSRAFVKSVTTLAQDLGISTVAEWVETAEDAQALTEIGVDALQGYHFGAPELRAWDVETELRP